MAKQIHNRAILINEVRDPRRTNLGTVGVALARAANSAAAGFNVKPQNRKGAV